jgi:hypothetical protein
MLIALTSHGGGLVTIVLSQFIWILVSQSPLFVLATLSSDLAIFLATGKWMIG